MAGHGVSNQLSNAFEIKKFLVPHLQIFYKTEINFKRTKKDMIPDPVCML